MRPHMRLFFDTETTAFWLFGKPAVHPEQPMLAQIAWVLDDDAGRTVSACSAILMQDKWASLADPSKYRPRVRMTDEVVKCHGITDKMVDDYGQPPDLVLNHFQRDLARASEVVGHNVSFDIGVINNTLSTQHLPPVVWPSSFCTKEKSTKIVGILGARGGFKWPNLSEAYHYFTQKKLSGAHDALIDVYGCRTVYRGIMGRAATD